MKVELKIKPLLVAMLGIIGIAGNAHAMKVGASADYPVAVGNMGENFTSNLGFSVAFYPDPLLDPKIDNFISASYDSLTVRADGTSSFRVIPVIVGIELPGRVFDDLKTTFAVGIGAAFTYLYTPSDTSNTKLNTYFAAQVKPGLAWDVTKEIAVTGQIPINILVTSHSLTYLAYTLGVQYNFGDSHNGASK